MLYLTLWDKISHYLAHLEANSHIIFQISQNFQTILQHILWRNKHKSHFIVFITSFLHLSKGFWLFLVSSKLLLVKISQNFVKSPLKHSLISQISVHSLWNVWMRHFYKRNVSTIMYISVSKTFQSGIRTYCSRTVIMTLYSGINETVPMNAIEPQHDKTNKVTMHPAKTQISLGIHPVWSESSLCT